MSEANGTNVGPSGAGVVVRLRLFVAVESTVPASYSAARAAMTSSEMSKLE